MRHIIHRPVRRYALGLLGGTLILATALNLTVAVGAAPGAAGSLVYGGGLSAAEVQRLAQSAAHPVIVILRDQHGDLSPRGVARAQRGAALAVDQAPVLGELARAGAMRVRPFHLINAVAATVSTAELANLGTLPQVQAVVPDASLPAPSATHPGAAVPSLPLASAQVPTCTLHPSLEPEALQLTHTAYLNRSIPQAQNIVTGTGVTVAILADAVDVHNPDLTRPDGSPVIVDEQDFTGDGPNAPSSNAEGYLDASSIAAQGNETYNVNDFVNAAHRRSVACPRITIRGMAPGAALMILKMRSSLTNRLTTSGIVQAIEYAVDHGADIINESFGAFSTPDNADSPIVLANDAAVRAGVTVVAATNDFGAPGTINTPAADPNIIAVGATTHFRSYAQVVGAGYQLGHGGYQSDNIASLNSSGPAQSGRSTVDVVAPGDAGWMLCTPDPVLYPACTDDNFQPSPILVGSGTSESAPLTAGEAALIIQAYRRTHGGASPSPALIKTIITSTATDLHAPGYEQGAGLIDSLSAVRAALSYQDANGHPAPRGTALLVTPGTLAAEGQPGTPRTLAISITNDGAQGQVVTPTVRTLDAPFFTAAYTPTLDPQRAPTFIDQYGLTEAYTEQDVAVPAGAQRLDASIAWDVRAQTQAFVSLTLFDPAGRFAAYSFPLGGILPLASGYGHVSVRLPAAGVWRAIIWTFAALPPYTYSGPVHLTVTASAFQSAGTVEPASRFLRPGETGSFAIEVRTPAEPGDESADVQIDAVDSAGDAHSAGAVPVILRSLVPLDGGRAAFDGSLVGGNGVRGQTLTYAFDVPAGQRDLALGLRVPDNASNLEGVLVDPAGLPLDTQSTVTALNPATGLPTAYTNTLQFFRRDPSAGRWSFILFVNDNLSGRRTALPFSATVALNTVSVTASGLPGSATEGLLGVGGGSSGDVGSSLAGDAVALPAGTPITATIIVTNTGNTTKDFFVDPRLATPAPLSLGGVSVPLPLPTSARPPLFYAPPESSGLTIAAESMSPTVPISMDVANFDGAPPDGYLNSPWVEALSQVAPASGNDAAVAQLSAPELPPGLWLAVPAEVGPFDKPAQASTAQLGAVAMAQPFDPAASSSSGDLYAVLTGQSSGPYSPLTLEPGASGTISVTITPGSAERTITRGVLYVDAVNVNSATFGPITGSGDELVALPYSYAIAASHDAAVLHKLN